LIRLERASYHARGGAAPALDEVSFEVPKGGLAWVVGPTGSGRSTLLRLLHGALRPTSGKVWVGGQDVGGLSEGALSEYRRAVGLVEATPRLLPHLTLLENVAVPLRLGGEPADLCQRRAREAMGDAGVAHKAKLLPQEASPADLARSALARALVCAPSVLLADEPTARLDPLLSQEILGLLREANVRGTTVLIAAHEPAPAQRGEQVLTLFQGRLQPPHAGA
jgi:ABC-type ATPase involved in cell division